MAENPVTDPVWYQTWGNGLLCVLVSVLGAIGTAAAFVTGIVRRLDAAESLARKAAEDLTQLGQDLRQHEDEDYEQFSTAFQKIDRLHEKIDTIAGPVERVDERTLSMQKSLATLEADHTYAHERIKIHDENSKAAAAKYEKEAAEIARAREQRIAELEAQVKELQK